MPRKSKPSTKRPYRKKPAYRKKKAQYVRRGNEYASLKQTIQLPDDPMNVIFRYNTLSLEAFDRASQVARAYQFFRVKMIEMKFKPYSDTYIPGGDPLAGKATPSLPYFYWMINKGDNLDPTSFNTLRDAGAKPIRFDDKTLTIRWKPSVLMFNRDVTSIGSAPTPSYSMNRTTPWLSTNDNAGQNAVVWAPNSTQHTGILYGVEQEVTVPDIIYQYGVEVTAHFEFMKPLTFEDDKAPSITLTKDTIPKVKVHPEVVV